MTGEIKTKSSRYLQAVKDDQKTIENISEQCF